MSDVFPIKESNEEREVVSTQLISSDSETITMIHDAEKGACQFRIEYEERVDG